MVKIKDGMGREESARRVEGGKIKGGGEKRTNIAKQGCPMVS